MQIKRIVIYSIILALQIFVNVLFINNINYFFIRSIFSFAFFTTVPGLLMLLILRVSRVSFFEYVSYMITLSLSLLLLGGLAFNTFLPLFGIAEPLSLTYLLPGFNIIVDILLASAILFGKRRIYYKAGFLNISQSNWTLLGLSFLLPVLSIFGATILNNGGTNLAATLFILSITVFVFLMTKMRKELDEKILPFVIFNMGISLLLSYSLRSWYILGWDINHEFQVFQLTKLHYLWSAATIKDIYNSCLSVTILPTILDSFLRVNDEYIFKVFYQILFALIPVNIYLITRRYTNVFYAFLAGLLFMIQQTFYMEMTAVVRQEIAFIFFTSSVLVLFNKTISENIQNFLFIIFGLGMIVSHYSTTYITLILFFLTYIITKIFSVINLSRIKQFFISSYSFNLRIIILLLLFQTTILWNVVVTNSFSNVTEVANTVSKNISKVFDVQNKSLTILSFLYNSKSAYTDRELNEFVQKYSSNYLSENKIDTIMKGETKNKTNLHIVNLYPHEQNGVSEKVLHLPYIITKYFIIFGLILGLLSLTLKKREDRIIDIEFVFIAIASLIMLAIMIIVPDLSVAYNVERLFQQCLVFISLFIILGISKLFSKLSPVNEYILASIIIIYYLYQSGIAASVIQDVLRVNLYNKGFEYDAHYTHVQDVAAAKWLSSNYDNKSTIYSDRLTHLKIDAHTNKILPIEEYIIPNLMDQYSYVYAGYTNIVKQVASIDNKVYFNKGIAFTNYPFDFLNSNKNLIYNNGGARIYK